MIRLPPISTSLPSSPPQLSLAPISPGLLLPSEQAALGVLSSPSTTPAPRTPEPTKKSRNNDLFSLDWSPVSPNVPSRCNTPPTPATPVEIPPPRLSWRAEEQQRELRQARRLSVDSGGQPVTPPSPKGPPRPPVVASDAKGFSPGQPPGLAPKVVNKAVPDTLPHTPTSPQFFRGETGRVEVRRGSVAAASASAHGAGISDNPVLDLRQSPRLRFVATSDYLLGEGRHATVYLASFLPQLASPLPPSWTLCAAKRVFPDRESQVAGLGEAFILSRLAGAQVPAFPAGSLAARGSRYIVGLYGVKDERDGVETVGEEDYVSRRKKAWEDASGSAGLGRSANWASQTDLRSTSEMTSVAAAAKIPQRRSLRRQHSFTPSDLSPLLGSPSAEGGAEFFASFSASDKEADVPHPLPQQLLEVQQSSRRRAPRHSEPVTPSRPFLAVEDHRKPSSTTLRLPATRSTPTSISYSADSPHMILLLEHCPFGHVLGFAKLFPERMGLRRWLEWAKQLVAAVAWAHERGVLHADIKPQNVLIASDLTIRLSDFGMSSFLPSPTSSQPYPTDPLGLGTPPYSPPEFVRPPPSPFGRPSDVFSLGVTLSVLISGHEPFEGMRTIERMLRVGRGGYWDWEERRREGGLESASVSRQGSVRSGRSRAGSGASWAGSTVGLSGLGARPGLGRRSDSLESERSVGSGMGGVGRSSWMLAASAKRLLADGEESDTEAVPSSPGTPSSPATSFFHHTTNLPFPVIPPPSPPVDDDDTASELSSADHDHAEDEDEDSTTAYVNTTYADGTPHQYFLNGEDVVPLEVRALLKRMTSPREGDRPTAKEVLDVLDAML